MIEWYKYPSFSLIFQFLSQNLLTFVLPKFDLQGLFPDPQIDKADLN